MTARTGLPKRRPSKDFDAWTRPSLHDRPPRQAPRTCTDYIEQHWGMVREPLVAVHALTAAQTRHHPDLQTQSDDDPSEELRPLALLIRTLINQNPRLARPHRMGVPS